VAKLLRADSSVTFRKIYIYILNQRLNHPLGRFSQRNHWSGSVNYAYTVRYNLTRQICAAIGSPDQVFFNTDVALRVTNDDTKCASGLLPDESETSLTFFSQPNPCAAVDDEKKSLVLFLDFLMLKRGTSCCYE
jgi:hypothetical protein